MSALKLPSISRCAALWLALILLAGSGFGEGAALAAASGGVAATVNGVAITMAELDDALHLAQVFSPEETTADLRTETLRNLMRRAAAVQEGQRRGFTASLSEVDDQIASLQARFGSRGRFFEVLSRNGISQSALQRQVAKDIIVFKLIQETVIPDVRVTDVDARYYYDSNPEYFQVPEKVRVRQILLKVPENADSTQKKEIRARLVQLRDIIVAGGDFSAVAQTHSEDTSAQNGGDIGFFSRDDVAKAFGDAAFILSPGEISDVVSTPLGYHIIQQIEKKPETVVPFGDVRAPLTRYLRRRLTDLSTKVYLDRLLSASEIKQFVK